MTDNPLDAALPDALRSVIGYEQKTQAPTEGESTMAENILTTDQVKAIAAEAAKSLMTQVDAEKAVASKIEVLTTEVTQAKAALATAVAEKTKLEAANATLITSAATLEKTLATATDKVAELTKVNSTLTVQVATAETEKAIATRVQALKTANIHTEARASKLTAVDPATGKFVMADASFTDIVGELKATFDAGKALSAVPTTPATPATAAPVQAVATVAAPATPAAPDLAKADAYTQATAALLTQAPVTSQGQAAYAGAFDVIE